MRKIFPVIAFLSVLAFAAPANNAHAQDSDKEVTAVENTGSAKVSNKTVKSEGKKAAEVATSGAEYVPGKPVEGVSYAKPWQINFVPPASPVKEKLHHLHNFLLVIITAVCVLVLLLLIYVCLRFRRKANPVPSTVTHNVLVEIIWTVVPVIILLSILIPSWRIITFMDKTSTPEITLKAIGYQWYWGYEYMDGPGRGIKFESYLKKPEDVKNTPYSGPYLLETDKRIVLPVDTDIKVLTTAADVIHSFAVPALGVKIDAVPGRVNETWMRITKPGVYYGQCSELCGSGHAFMPIAIEAVSKDVYLSWVKENKGEVAAPVEASANNAKEPVSKEAEKAVPTLTEAEKAAQKVKIVGTNALTEEVAKEKAKNNK